MSEPPDPSAAERVVIVGVTGASGALYARRLIETLLATPTHRVHFVATPAGLRVLQEELGPPAEAGRLPRPTSGGGRDADGAVPPPVARCLALAPDRLSRLTYYPPGDIGAPPASGTFLHAGMIVMPCSMNTLAQIAHGLQPNLLARSAAVTLKEGRPLILAPRETPLGLIELRNMVQLTEAGGVILPLSPGFYQAPRTIEDLVDFVVQKALDRLGLPVPKPVRWTGSAPGRRSRRPA